jgi:hypothetical protein
LAIAKRWLYGSNFDFPKLAIASVQTELSVRNARFDGRFYYLMIRPLAGFFRYVLVPNKWVAGAQRGATGEMAGPAARCVGDNG